MSDFIYVNYNNTDTTLCDVWCFDDWSGISKPHDRLLWVVRNCAVDDLLTRYDNEGVITADLLADHDMECWDEGTEYYEEMKEWIPKHYLPQSEFVNKYQLSFFDVKRAYNRGVIRFETNYEPIPICVIGCNWFYFVGADGEGMTHQEYIDTFGLNTALHEVHSALTDPIGYGLDWTEGLYYVYTIQEALNI